MLRIVGELSQILRFCCYSRKLFPQNLGAWHLPFCKNLVQRYIYLQFKPPLTIYGLINCSSTIQQKKVRNCKYYRVLVLSLVHVSVSFVSHIVT